MLDKLKNTGLMTKLTLVGVSIFICMILIAIESVSTTYDLVYGDRQTKTRQLVEVVYDVVDTYYDQQKQGILSESEAKKKAATAVNALRYEKTEYFWIHDLGKPTPSMVMHPTIPTLNGKILDSEKFNKAISMQYGETADRIELNDYNLFVSFNTVVEKNGHGYVEYMWPKPIDGGGVTEELYRKLSYVKKFEPWGWVIGSGIYIDDVDVIFRTHLSHSLSLAIFSILLIIVVSWMIRKSILDEFKEDHQNIIERISTVSASDLMLDHNKPETRTVNHKLKPHKNNLDT